MANPNQPPDAAGSVADIFKIAGHAFLNLSQLTASLKASQPNNGGAQTQQPNPGDINAKWTAEELAALKSALSTFATQLESISTRIRGKNVEQIRTTLEKKAYTEVGLAPPPPQPLNPRLQPPPIQVSGASYSSSPSMHHANKVFVQQSPSSTPQPLQTQTIQQTVTPTASATTQRVIYQSPSSTPGQRVVYQQATPGGGNKIIIQPQQSGLTNIAGQQVIRLPSGQQVVALPNQAAVSGQPQRYVLQTSSTGGAAGTQQQQTTISQQQHPQTAQYITVPSSSGGQNIVRIVRPTASQTIIRQGAPQQVIQGLPQNIRLASPSPQIITSQQQVVVSTPQQLQPQIVQQSEVPQAVTEIVSQ